VRVDDEEGDPERDAQVAAEDELEDGPRRLRFSPPQELPGS
jgi:hypothetical protein